MYHLRPLARIIPTPDSRFWRIGNTEENRALTVGSLGQVFWWFCFGEKTLFLPKRIWNQVTTEFDYDRFIFLVTGLPHWTPRDWKCSKSLPLARILKVVKSGRMPAVQSQNGDTRRLAAQFLITILSLILPTRGDAQIHERRSGHGYAYGLHHSQQGRCEWGQHELLAKLAEQGLLENWCGVLHSIYLICRNTFNYGMVHIVKTYNERHYE